jgi:hypothetical protein
MAQLFRLKDLAARKQALLAESEVYRQSLKLELQNVKLHGLRFRRKFGFLKVAKQLIFLLPVLRGVWVWRGSAGAPGEKTSARRRGTLGLLLTGWRVYRNLAPVIRGVVSRRLFKSRGNGAQDRTLAANI